VRGRADQDEVGKGDGSQLIAKHGAERSRNRVRAGNCCQSTV